MYYVHIYYAHLCNFLIEREVEGNDERHSEEEDADDVDEEQLLGSLVLLKRTDLNAAQCVHTCTCTSQTDLR